LATARPYYPGGLLDVDEAYVYRFYEAATQSFVAGAPVNLASGKVQLVVAAGNNLGANDDLLGIALEPATGVTGLAGAEADKIGVYVFTRPIVLRLPVYHGTPASAITAISQIGTAYELRWDATQGLCVAIDATTNTKGKVIDIPNTKEMPVGTQYGLVDFMIDPAQCQFPNT